ncbi:MAG: cobyrinic acid a,c-diamide synthase [Deltaproteobacteria bacterium]|nr:MAG: cobyrinic acid a,c-diamide synthase [Deltaproteobacteria bacterium]
MTRTNHPGQARLPRLLVAGLGGDTGKTLVALGLVRHLVDAGRRPAVFKKGPDFIDAAWLGAAAREPGRNLDTFMMPPEAVLWSLGRAAGRCHLAVIEGNRGLFDGLDAAGSHSSAALARLTATPVVLVVDTTKSTRTVAAAVLGCQRLEPELDLAGVILNRVGTARQENTIRRAIKDATGLPVLGALPRLERQVLPARHLGLVTAREHETSDGALEYLAEAAGRYLDCAALEDLAGRAGPLPPSVHTRPVAAAPRRVTIGVLRDQAFTFYYPENLEALEAAGAELVDIDARHDEQLPALDALLAGGGFPEQHAAALANNAALRGRLRRAVEQGLPVWAECGGLMYLSQAIVEQDRVYPMVGALPLRVTRRRRPQGHGYVIARVDRSNPFLPVGRVIHGHEFHYSRPAGQVAVDSSVMKLERGTGLGQGRDGLVVGNVLACYTHLHALGVPEWAGALVAAAARGNLPGRQGASWA